jgi:hypothetical protein
MLDDTDRLLAGLFAATMTARLNVAKVSDFWAFYDTCEKAIVDRKAKSKAGADLQDREAWDKL